MLPITEIRHLAWVLAHNGFDDGQGGCSCDLCSLLREIKADIQKREADEYVAALHKGIDTL